MEDVLDTSLLAKIIMALELLTDHREHHSNSQDCPRSRTASHTVPRMFLYEGLDRILFFFPMKPQPGRKEGGSSFHEPICSFYSFIYPLIHFSGMNRIDPACHCQTTWGSSSLAWPPVAASRTCPVDTWISPPSI